MADIKKLLESLSNLSTNKFPGYWKGTDPAKKARSKMVGSAQESIMKEIHSAEKTTRTHRSLKEKFQNFKEQIRVGDMNLTPDQVKQILSDPRGLPMQMPDEIQNVMTGSGEPLRSGSGDPVRSGTTKPGAIRYIKPDSSEMDKIYDPPPKPVRAEPVRQPVAVATPLKLGRTSQPDPDLAPIERTVIQTPDTVTTARTATTVPRAAEVRRLPDVPADNNTTPGIPVQQRVEPGTPTDLVSMVKNLRNADISRPQIVQNLAALNNIQDANKIRVGQVIRLFDANGQPYNYKIGPGDNLWNISRGKLKGQRIEESTKLNKILDEYKIFLEYGNAQDPNAQTTSQQKTGSPEEQAKVNKEKQDQRMDIATAKSVASSIKPALPPSVDPNALAGALVKIDDQNSGKPSKPLTQPEQMAMGPMNALVTKAAVTGQTATTLSSILRSVADLAKKGKA